MRIAGTRYLATRQVYYSKPENEGCSYRAEKLFTYSMGILWLNHM